MLAERLDRLAEIEPQRLSLGERNPGRTAPVGRGGRVATGGARANASSASSRRGRK
jgi:hypothetical protein